MAHEEPGKTDAASLTMESRADLAQDAEAGGNDPETQTEENQNASDGKKIKQLTLRLPEEYHRKLKILAACSGKSMTEILVRCIDERLEHCLERELKNVK